MNAIFFHMTGFKKNHQQQKMAKTFETNITSDKGEEKSSSQTSNQNNPPPKKHLNLYLIQYQKYFNKKLVIKYNILPNEYNLMNLDNFITAKYCHSLASFKEKLIFNYDEEFLNRFYTKKESKRKIPLFADFYKSYLKFFCFPTLSELKLNDLIEDMVEKKAKAFYNENFSEKSDKNEKKIKVVIFTNKIRQDISRRNSLTNLTKTTIKNHSITNKSSASLLTIEKIFNEMNNEKKKINNNNNNTNRNIYNKLSIKNINHNNSLNKGLKNSVIIRKIKKKIKNIETEKELNNISNKIKNNTTDCASSGKSKKIKNKIKRNIQNKLLENKTSKINSKKNSSIQKNLNLILKLNSKINFNKNIYIPLDNQRLSSNSKNNSKNLFKEKNKPKELKSKQISNNVLSTTNASNIYKNYCNTLNTNFIIKNNTLISNFNNNTHNGNLKVHSTNINTNYLGVISGNKKYNFITHKTISNSNNNSNRNIQKKSIKVIKKPSLQKIKQIRQIKSRNFKSVNDTNTNVNEINSIQPKNELKLKNISKENISDYYTINNKNINTISIKISNQKSKPKIKLIKAENKINLNNNNNNGSIKHNNQNLNTNAKVFNFITARKKNTNYFITSNFNKGNRSSSSSLKNLNEKSHVINNGVRKNRVVNSKNHTSKNTNSYVMYDSQKIIKNLKVTTNRENSKNMLVDYKVKVIKKFNESPINNNDIKKNKANKNYYKK